ncbi:hypothetical protein BGX30_002138, partial [Mortierella sp. GBA39]
RTAGSAVMALFQVDLQRHPIRGYADQGSGLPDLDRVRLAVGDHSPHFPPVSASLWLHGWKSGMLGIHFRPSRMTSL